MSKSRSMSSGSKRANGNSGTLADQQDSSREKIIAAARKVFAEHGYLIRKLNQAYFAFYGAYADSPGGAAGEDPVGPAVRALRARSISLTDFLETIASMSSFEELQKGVSPSTTTR